MFSTGIIFEVLSDAEGKRYLLTDNLVFDISTANLYQGNGVLMLRGTHGNPFCLQRASALVNRSFRFARFLVVRK